MPAGIIGSSAGGSVIGYADYSDLATATTPISHTGGATTVLTNDTLGAQTSEDKLPTGITSIWDAVGSTFDFSQLDNGDLIDIRLDVEITTSSPNQELDVILELGQGGFSYPIDFDNEVVKSAGVHPVSRFIGIYIGDDNTRLNNAQFLLTSPDDATIHVLGWYCKVIRR